jgi:hypothetical protein
MDQHITWREDASSGAGGKVAVDVNVVEEPKVAAALLRDLAETLDPTPVLHRRGGCVGTYAGDDKVTCSTCRLYLADLHRAVEEACGRANVEIEGMKADLARLVAERLRLVEAIGKKTMEAVDSLRDLRAMTSVGTGECGHRDFPGLTCIAVRDKNGRCVFGCARVNDAIRAAMVAGEPTR